jgi:hypothetical protein
LELYLAIGEKLASDKLPDGLEQKDGRASVTYRRQYQTKRCVSLFISIDVQDSSRSPKSINQAGKAVSIGEAMYLQPY